ncbi:uncharacterized protein [Rutidosis leptorrhynchoides]|uniref:uncharacterized protein n=1 Tax=Rutidosis leptorrhynchoides TaxID=125765 RepID=UPI003A9A4E9D
MTSSFTVKMMDGSLPPVTVSTVLPTTPVKPPTLPLQVRFKKLQKLETPNKTSKNISRRDLALFLPAAASFSAVTLSSPKPAQARMSRSEIKKMLLEKLKMLREKAGGLSKPEPEEIEKVTTPPSPLEDKKVQSSPYPSVANKEIHSSPAPPIVEKTDHSSPSPPVAEREVHVPQEPPLPNIQNDKKNVVEAPTLP